MKEWYCRQCMKEIDKEITIFDYLTQDQLLCSTCKAQLVKLDRSVTWKKIHIHMLYEYNDFFENMIFQFKEGHDVALKDVFFHEYIKKINDKYRHHTIVLMPSSEEKMQERGFLPMRAMLENCKLPIIEPFYKSENRKQSLQSLSQRHHINEVMHLIPGVKLPQRKLLLMDDVCTSGSTLEWAYRMLERHTYKIDALMLSVHPLFVESCDKKGLKKERIFSILKHGTSKGR